MAGKSGGNAKSNSKDPADWQKYDFANINLDAEQKKLFKTMWEKDPQKFLSELPDYALAGYKQSISWDEGNQTYVASMTCRKATDVNFNFVLTSRSKDFWEAQALNIFKTQHCCENETWADAASDASWG